MSIRSTQGGSHAVVFWQDTCISIRNVNPQLTLSSDGILFETDLEVTRRGVVAGDGAFFLFNSSISFDINCIFCTTPLMASAFACTASTSMSSLFCESDFGDWEICLDLP